MQGKVERTRSVSAEKALATARVRIEAEYRRRTPTSEVLREAAKRVLPGGDTRTITYFTPYSLFMAVGKGCRLTDVDGNVYLDCLNNYASLVHGHAHPRITEEVSHQIARGTAYAAPTESQTQLAQRICQRVKSVERVRFCNSGTEATMNAIRAAKTYTGRNKILKMEGGYHGTHDAVKVSTTPPLDRAGLAEAPRPVPDSGGLSRDVIADTLVAPFNNVEATTRIIDRNGNDLAAVIVEPVMGAGGMIPAQADYLCFLREATRSCGALLIIDEVITFRLAYGGAQEIYGVRPDLTAFGKAIGGGFPVGAFGGRADVMASFDPEGGELTHSGTFNGNPVTMAAGIVALDLLTPEEIARINKLGERLRQGICQVLAEVGTTGQVTGMGSLLQLHFSEGEVTNYRSSARSSKELQHLLHLSLLNRGCFNAPRGQFILSTPMGKGEVDEVVTAVREALVDLDFSSPAF